MVESTSDDSESSDADAASGGSGGPEAIDKDTEEQKLIVEMCRPMTKIMAGLPKETTRKFVFDACAGLSGSETLNRYPCIYEESSRRFFVWLGDTDIALFTKSTFMNLSNFAEFEVGATSATFLVFHQHRQKAQYRSLFRVIDAK